MIRAMEKELAQHLITVAEAYAAANDGVQLTTLARRAAGDWRFFDRLRDEDKTFTARKYDEVIRWFSDRWPPATCWPAAVPRPAPSDLAPSS